MPHLGLSKNGILSNKNENSIFIRRYKIKNWTTQTLNAQGSQLEHPRKNAQKYRIMEQYRQFAVTINARKTPRNAHWKFNENRTKNGQSHPLCTQEKKTTIYRG